jgi:hypothetical protein
MSKWQPIETAPRSQIIDLWCEGERVPDCMFRVNLDEQTQGFYFWPKGCQNHAWISVEKVFGTPSHWMPLPPPPTP